MRRRAADLHIAHAVFGVVDKLQAAQSVIATLQLPWNAIAVMGDDWPDLPLLARAVFACTPPGAHIEARAIASYVTQAAAGHGAARELCDLLLCGAGAYARLLNGHLTTLDDGG